MPNKLSNVQFLDDKPKEECGVFGVYAPERDVARMAFFALYALQHRGQESAGIVTCDGQRAYQCKDMGLVSQVFNEDNLSPLKGHLGIGHTRYSTTGGVKITNAQPYLIETINGPLGLAHNGNLTNSLQIRLDLLNRGVGLTSSSDSEMITQIIAAPTVVWGDDKLPETTDDHWVNQIRMFMHKADGAYSLTLLTRNAVYAVRDPLGLRPLCIGEFDDGSMVVVSESCALSTIGADFVRDVNPGEIVRLNADGLTSFVGQEAKPKRAMCVFEYVYFARPDSQFDGQLIHKARQSMGRQLAREAPADVDMIVPVPDSATPAAIGYSVELGIPFTEGLTKNRYIGRTFIQPDDALRKQGISLKFNVLTNNLQGKRIVLIDDSIVRGNTLQALVKLLRSAGVAEVHVRVSSPPVRHPCFMGVDMATYNELIANKLDIEGIRQEIDADSLAYLSLPGMLNAIEEGVESDGGFCDACFSGTYPIEIPAWLMEEDRDKMLFEEVWGG